MTLEQLFAGRAVNIPHMKARLNHVADELGLPLGDRNKTYNSRLAQELGKWAESKDRGDAFHDAVFRAYFVDGKNIGRVDELADLVRSVGLPDQEAQKVLEERTFEEEVDRDWARAHTMGITAVPTFLVRGQILVGAQPYDVLERFMRACQVEKRHLSA